jgi:serologically defined colon cancer antigen 8
VKEIDDLRRTIEDLKGEIERQIADSSKELADAEQRFQQELRDLRRRASEKDGVSQSRVDQMVADHESQIAMWEKRYNDFVADTKRKEELMHQELLLVQRSSLEATELVHRQYEQQLRHRALEFQRGKFELTEELDRARSESADRLRDLQELLSNSEQLRARLTEKLEAVSSERNQSLETLRSGFELRFQDLLKKKDLELQLANAAFSEELLTLRKKHRDEVTSLEEHHENAIRELERAAKQRLKQVEEKAELELRLAIENHKNEVDQKASADIGVLREALGAEHEALRRELSRKSSEFDKHRAELEIDLLNRDQRIGELECELERSRSSWIEERLKLISDHRGIVDDFESRFSQQRQENDLVVGKLRSKCGGIAADCQQKLAENENRWVSEISTLKTDYESQLARKQEEIDRMSSEIQRLKVAIEDSAGKSASELSQLTKSHEETINALKTSYEQQIDRLDQCHDELVNKLKEENADMREQLRDANDRETDLRASMERLSSANDEDVMNRISELERQKLCDLQGQRTAYENRIGELTKQTEDLMRQIEETKAECDEQMKSQRAAFEHQLRDARERHQARVQKKSESWHRKLAERDRMIEQLKCEIRQWEEKYQTRDARPEDVEQIRSLETSLQERTDALAKLFLELKHYQNELLNRESSYSKVFTRRPSIGVLNVIETRVKRDSLLAEIQPPTNLPPLGANPVEPRAESATARQLLPVAQKKNAKRPLMTPKK